MLRSQQSKGRGKSHSVVMECNYDSSSTRLYKLIQQTEWQLATVRCRTFAHEAQTWIYRLEKESKMVRWRMLPIHASILFKAPIDVVQTIIDAYPDGVKEQDDQGMLPLHLAVHSRDIDKQIIDLLLERYPEAIHVKDKKLRTVADIAEKFRNEGSKEKTTEPASDSKAGSNTEERDDEGPIKREGFAFLSEAHDDQLTRLKHEHDVNTAALKQSYEDQIDTLEKKWKEKLIEKEKEILSRHEPQLGKILKDHDETMARVKSSMTEDVDKGKELIEMLKEEVADLKKQRNKFKGQCDLYKTIMEGTKKKQAQLHAEIHEMAQNQDTIVELALRQREEMETAYAVRDKLIQGLLSQEDEDRMNHMQGGEDLMDLIEMGRTKMGNILTWLPASKNSSSGASVTPTVALQHFISHGPGPVAGSVNMSPMGLTSIEEEGRALSEDKDDISAMTDVSGF